MMTDLPARLCSPPFLRLPFRSGRVDGSRCRLLIRKPGLPLCLLMLGVLIPLMLGGCRGSGSGPFPLIAYSDDGDLLPKPTGAGLVVDPKAEIPDVPRPIGFVGVPSKSYSSVDPLTGVRTVVHVYQGRSNSQDAAAYFRRYLDDYGWELDGFDQGDPRATVQAYTKGPEQLRITIASDRGITTLNVTISPVNAPPA